MVDPFLREHLIEMILKHEALMAQYLLLAEAAGPRKEHYERAAAFLGEVIEKLTSGFEQLYPEEDLSAVLQGHRKSGPEGPWS